eukprot:1348565-Pyramimonas_sp.AAC.1
MATLCAKRATRLQRIHRIGQLTARFARQALPSPRNAVLGGETHANAATGAVGGAPHGATKRCPAWGRRMRTPLLGPS